MFVSRVARLQSGQPVAVFYSFGHPTPYAYVVSHLSMAGMALLADPDRNLIRKQVASLDCVKGEPN
jgi:hypothetical protein